MKLKKILFILFIFPTIIAGQNNDVKLDSIFNINSIDMTQRKVYEVVEIMPKFENGEDIIQYIAKKNELFTSEDCIANRVFISFVVETDSSITNRKVYVESVFSKEKGLLRKGQELKEIQSKIEKGLEYLNLMTPGKLNNKAVATRVLFPIHFDINN